MFGSHLVPTVWSSVKGHSYDLVKSDVHFSSSLVKK